jgi:hypothetical protein
VVRFTQPPYGTLDAAEWAPSTASKADMTTLPRDVRFTPRKQTFTGRIVMSLCGRSGHRLPL